MEITKCDIQIRKRWVYGSYLYYVTTLLLYPTLNLFPPPLFMPQRESHAHIVYHIIADSSRLLPGAAIVRKRYADNHPMPGHGLYIPRVAEQNQSAGIRGGFRFQGG